MKPKQFADDKTAQRNIWLLVVQKIFAKRVFLPLSAIYFTEVGGFTLKEIAVCAMIFALTQILAEVPTGFFADKVARVTSIRIAALLNICSTLLYVLAPNHVGIYFGVAIEALGYSFLSGAGEALLHDTLDWQGRKSDYTRVSSKMQAVSLIANAILIALVPMTYVIDKRLPFLIGTFAYTILLIAGLFMREVPRHRPVKREKNYQIIRGMAGRSFVAFLAVYGLIAAMQVAPVDYINLTLREFGLKPEYIGWLYAAASIFGAIIGPFIKYFKRLSLASYMAFDALLASSLLIIMLTANLYIVGAVFIINFAFWRYRKIIYQDYLLNHKSAEYKATLLSLLNNASQINELWLPLLFGGVTSAVGLRMGLGYIGIASLMLIPAGYLVARWFTNSSVTGEKQV